VDKLGLVGIEEDSTIEWDEEVGVVEGIEIEEDSTVE